MEDIKRLILPAIAAVVLHGFLISSNLPKREMSRPSYKEDSIAIEMNAYFQNTIAQQKNEKEKEEIDSTKIPHVNSAEIKTITQSIVNPEKHKKVLIKPKQRKKEAIIDGSGEKTDIRNKQVENNEITHNQLPVKNKHDNYIIDKTSSATQSGISKNESEKDLGNIEKSLGIIPKTAFPNYRKNKQPQYPVMARRRGYEGEILLSVLVDTKGFVSEIKIKHSSGHLSLDKAALQAIKSWIFTPATDGVRPVIMWVDVPVRFQLK
jgi:protein TonB